MTLLPGGVAGLVPARWTSGDPQSLDRLAGGPVNCILLGPVKDGTGIDIDCIGVAATLQLDSIFR